MNNNNNSLSLTTLLIILCISCGGGSTSKNSNITGLPAESATLDESKVMISNFAAIGIGFDEIFEDDNSENISSSDANTSDTNSSDTSNSDTNNSDTNSSDANSSDTSTSKPIKTLINSANCKSGHITINTDISPSDFTNNPGTILTATFELDNCVPDMIEYACQIEPVVNGSVTCKMSTTEDDTGTLLNIHCYSAQNCSGLSVSFEGNTYQYGINGESVIRTTESGEGDDDPLSTTGTFCVEEKIYEGTNLYKKSYLEALECDE